MKQTQHWFRLDHQVWPWPYLELAWLTWTLHIALQLLEWTFDENVMKILPRVKGDMKQTLTFQCDLDIEPARLTQGFNTSLYWGEYLTMLNENSSKGLVANGDNTFYDIKDSMRWPSSRIWYDDRSAQLQVNSASVQCGSGYFSHQGQPGLSLP